MFKLLHNEQQYLSELKGMHSDKKLDSDLENIEEINIGQEGIFGNVLIRLSKGEATVAGLAAAAAIIWFGAKIVLKLSQSNRCRAMKPGSTPGRICENEVIIATEKRRIDILKSKMHLCRNSKDRQKCEGKVKEKIVKSEAKIKAKLARIKELKQRGKV